MKNPTTLFDEVWEAHQNANAELREKCRQTRNAARTQQALAVGLANSQKRQYPRISFVLNRWEQPVFAQLVTVEEVHRLELGEDGMPILKQRHVDYILRDRP